jgi:YggT family protein
MTIIWHLLFFAAVVLGYLLQALVWLVIANAVVSWLIAFDIINMRNRTAYAVVRGLDRVVSPFLKPFRRFIPPLGGMDITPLILIVLIAAAQQTLLSPLIGWLHAMSEGGLQS